jgi:lysine biosynthesis protein LysW
MLNQNGDKPISCRCIECDARIFIKKHPHLGDEVVCPECGTFLEVVSVSPLKLYWMFEDEGDNDGDYQSNHDDDYSSSMDEFTDWGDD